MRFRQWFAKIGHHEIYEEDVILPEIEIENLNDFLRFVSESNRDVVVKAPVIRNDVWKLLLIE